MTDNEIIKALESEIHLAEYVDSDYCSNVKLEIIKSALDLITRQQAELDNLKVKNQSLRSAGNSLKTHYEKAQAEVERLNAENMLTISERNAFRTSFYNVLKQLKTVKSEAYKEFAERLKKEISAYRRKCRDTGDDEGVFAVDKVRQKIDNLVKEMVGESNSDE